MPGIRPDQKHAVVNVLQHEVDFLARLDVGPDMGVQAWHHLFGRHGCGRLAEPFGNAG
ncbi:hypothetical protein RFM26_02955 [Mesorhizobium sp. VK23B]|uniref:Uncharacterized protein n=1 Tax=Mesorhizobium dulcispinae TaxID=3072316 RepID=A0ABU4X8A5_9HYPH|nr:MULTISPECIES: hypothetical protein [unclassified Mesorhizobium]MDX8464641.1 hypothetical protein [Mesorhizobium sp. VK23B]MDX8471027.1 hypothetical protein [Mesorhizobium sp. VK23A]